MNFKVGDRVKVGRGKILIKSVMLQYPYATVIGFRLRYGYAIRFDEHIHGHDCRGWCEDGHGWFVHESNLTHAFKPTNKLEKHKLLP